MVLRSTLRLAAAALVLAMMPALGGLQPLRAQTPPAANPASPAQPPAAAPAPAPAAPTTPAAPAFPAAPSDSAPPAASAPAATPPFGEDITLTAKPIIYVKGNGTWDKAFDTLSTAFKKLKAYTDKEGIKTDGLQMTIFTSTDDAGFQYEAAVPVTEPPKNLPPGIASGQSPAGHALKFLHQGSYDDLDNTYEAITNHLDEQRLEAQDLFIEQYVTDPTTADPSKLTVNVIVMLKQ
jgi:effector-binding domain-containing protein